MAKAAVANLNSFNTRSNLDMLADSLNRNVAPMCSTDAFVSLCRKAMAEDKMVSPSEP